MVDQDPGAWQKENEIKTEPFQECKHRNFLKSTGQAKYMIVFKMKNLAKEQDGREQVYTNKNMEVEMAWACFENKTRLLIWLPGYFSLNSDSTCR